jgi:hypothetical protein
MTASVSVDAHNRPATGIPPIQCTSWCRDGDGHIGEVFRGDQRCYSRDAYIYPSLEYGPDGESMIGAHACRDFNSYPVVEVHAYGFNPCIDATIHLTAAEAHALAQALTVAADLIGGCASE